MTLWSWALLPWSVFQLGVCRLTWLACQRRDDRWRWKPVFCGVCFWGGPLGQAKVEGSVFVCPRCLDGEV